MARKFLYLVAVLIVLAIAGLLALRYWADDLTALAFVPQTAFVKQDPLAANAYQELGLFSEAANYHDIIVQNWPKYEHHKDAAFNAVLLRTTVGEHAKAIDSGNKFRRHYPRDEEADSVVQAPCGIGRQRAGGGHVPGELGDADGAEEAGDEREHHRQRKRAAGEGGTRWDGRRDGRGGGHVRDALEEHLPKPDGVLAQGDRGRSSLIGHLDLAAD